MGEARKGGGDREGESESCRWERAHGWTGGDGADDADADVAHPILRRPAAAGKGADPLGVRERRQPEVPDHAFGHGVRGERGHGAG